MIADDTRLATAVIMDARNKCGHDTRMEVYGIRYEARRAEAVCAGPVTASGFAVVVLHAAGVAVMSG